MQEQNKGFEDSSLFLFAWMPKAGIAANKVKKSIGKANKRTLCCCLLTCPILAQF